jgi:hypothetical protein
MGSIAGMRTSRIVRAAATATAAAAGVTVLLVSPVATQAAAARPIALVDVAPDGTPGNGGIGGSDISDDGRYVARLPLARASPASGAVWADVVVEPLA